LILNFSLNSAVVEMVGFKLRHNYSAYVWFLVCKFSLSKNNDKMIGCHSNEEQQQY